MKQKITSQLKNMYSHTVSVMSKKKESIPLQEGVAYLMSFPNNDNGLIQAIHEKVPVRVYYTSSCLQEAERLKEKGIQIFDLNHPVSFLKSMKDIGCSKVVVADNYFPFLGDIAFSSEQTVFLLWHATGAIKQFGLEDQSVVSRTDTDKKRFKRVYDSFDYVFVASERMGNVFRVSYGMAAEQMLLLGFPRTDYLVNESVKKKSSSRGRNIVYLPTYRGNEPESSWLLDLQRVVDSLEPEDELLVKLHPHVHLPEKKISQLKWVPSNMPADALIEIADCLITDYSSVAFDYTLCHPEGQLIIFWPDSGHYRETTGIQLNIESDFPNKVCYDTASVIEQLQSKEIGNNEHFNRLWNTYNDGVATSRVVQEIKKAVEKK